jgi:phospholipase/lecithinase/hemolysin
VNRSLSLSRRPRPSLQRLEDRTVPAQAAVGDLVVFGDSLADVGNVSAATGGTLPPSSLYYQGRFTGGAIWIDTLAEAVGAAPARPSLLGGTDYAFGGATLSATPFFGVPKVGAQVDQYLASHTPARDDLFAFWAGANDFFSDNTLSPTVPAAELVSQVRELAAAGARNFVINELPPLGATPFFQDLKAAGFIDDATIAGVNAWAAGFNDAVAAGLAAVKADFHKANIVTVGTESLFAQYAAPGNPLGFTDWTHAVGPYDTTPGNGGLLQSITAANPGDYLFYDSVHPGTRAHQAIGLHAAADVLESLHVNRLTVTTTSDAVDPLDGGRSLREVLALAELMEGRQTVSFDLGTGPKTIRLGGSALAVGDDLTLVGRPGLKISGAGDSRILDVSAGANVSLSTLSLVRGNADQGGAIRNAGTLQLSDVVLANNKAGQGGAIYNTGSLGLSGSLVLSNTASGAGGGIAASSGGTLRVEGSTLLGNRAGQGGGVHVGAGSSLTLTDATVIGNAALGDEDGEGLGGGVYLAAGSTFSRLRSAIRFNFAGTAGPNVFRA